MRDRYAPPPSMQQEHHGSGFRPGLGLTLGLGAAAGLLAYGIVQARDRDRHLRPGDDAPGRTARHPSFGPMAVTGRTVTINRPRTEIYAFWRKFSNLAAFMENVEAVEEVGDVIRWTIAAPAGRSVSIESRIAQDREGEMISWESTGNSQIETQGKVSFRDAPGNRGTEVEAIIAYRPPGGELGRLAAKLFQAEPRVQSRRDLKRLKMLLETGEIATNRNRRAAD